MGMPWTLSDRLQLGFLITMAVLVLAIIIAMAVPLGPQARYVPPAGPIASVTTEPAKVLCILAKEQARKVASEASLFAPTRSDQVALTLDLVAHAETVAGVAIPSLLTSGTAAGYLPLRSLGTDRYALPPC